MNQSTEILATPGVDASARPALAPLPRVAINIRPGTLADVPFMDSLQKLHTKQVGWMPTAQFEGKIKLGHVLVAEESCRVGFSPPSANEGGGLKPTLQEARAPLGYCIGNDQYFKRDDVGIIYQVNVAPGNQRGFIGASLVKAMFDRAAWGCRLFCCWCAQDIEANKFWESLGFVPLAFRAGSAKKGPKGPQGRGRARVHIFWQRRIRAGDSTTPYWFPSQTSSGSIREDRIVLPIPPGTHWRDAKPIVLPGDGLPGDDCQLPIEKPARAKRAKQPVIVETNKPAARAILGLHFVTPSDPSVEKAVQLAKPKPPRVKTQRVKTKNDPRLIAAARELRDRWLDEVNAGRFLPVANGKYDVGRMLTTGCEPPLSIETQTIRALPALPLPEAA